MIFDEILEYLRAQGKPAQEHKIGIEHEKIGVLPATLRSIPFEGELGIESLLRRWRERYGYEPVEEGGRLIGLSRGKVKISLEPGGQLEFAGSPFRSLAPLARELDEHLAELADVGADLGCAWLSLGENPLVPLAEIPWMPKSRYRIMRQYMPRRGHRGHYMMKATATVQATVDFRDEEDACRKIRAAMSVSPLVTALYSNSSITAESLEIPGRPAPQDQRYLEWLDTDPDRCGLLPFVFQPDFSFRHYVEWLLDMPMYFLQRGDALIECAGASFREGMERGELGLEDFKLHMSTAFPEVRLKSTIEMRGADGAPLAYLKALPAIWKGLLYDDRALEQAWSLLSDLSFPERQQLVLVVGHYGLEAVLRGRPVAEWAKELLSIARAGLARQGAAEEASFLEPLEERARIGKSLAREAWERWHGEWNRNPQSLIEWARLV